MKKKVVKVDDFREWIKDIYMVNEGEYFGEIGEEEKVEELNVENNVFM